MQTTDGVWLSILEYSNYKKVSISTIRRHIKNKILRFKEEDGKYFIYVASREKLQQNEKDDLLKLKLELESMKKKLMNLQQENCELTMLVNLYEKKDIEHSKETSELFIEMNVDSVPPLPSLTFLPEAL